MLQEIQNYQNQVNRRVLIKNQYHLLQKLSEGQYGKVYKAQDLQTQKFVAIKMMKNSFESSGIFNSNLREISTLKNLDNENVVKLLDQFFENDYLYIVLEYVEYDLRKLIINQINEKKYFSNIKIKSIMYQLIKGIYHIHSSGFIHRDLKPANILVTQSGQIKIADFGLSKAINIRQTKMTPNWITLWYRPLEMLQGQQEYTQVVDIWSLGCIFAEIINLQPLFMEDNNYRMIHAILRVRGFPINWDDLKNDGLNIENIKQKQSEEPIEQISRDLCEDGKDLLRKMLCTNPNARISAKECLNHPYFKQIIGLSLTQIEELEKEQLDFDSKTFVDQCNLEAAQEDGI